MTSFQLTAETCFVCYLNNRLPFNTPEVNLNLTFEATPFQGLVYVPWYQSYFNLAVNKLTQGEGWFNPSFAGVFHLYIPLENGKIWNDGIADLVSLNTGTNTYVTTSLVEVAPRLTPEINSGIMLLIGLVMLGLFRKVRL